MEEDRDRDDPMDVNQAEDPSLPSTNFGSPSYSAPELDEYIEEKEEVSDDHDEAEEEDDEEERAARRKAKGKARASSLEEDEEDEEQRAAHRKAKGKARASSLEEVDEDEEEQREARRKGKGKGKASLPPGEDDNDADDERPSESPGITKSKPFLPLITIAEDTGMDMDTYWASYGREMQFGDADAAMNETLSSPSSPDHENKENTLNTTPAARNTFLEHRSVTTLNTSTLVDKLAAVQQRQADGGRGRGSGRGRGKGGGWGLEWQETITPEQVEREGMGIYEDPIPSPSDQLVQEDLGWEVYDEAAWERAAEERTKEEDEKKGKVTLKMPSLTKGEASTKKSAVGTDKNEKVNEKTTQSGELVRAVRDYKAIFRADYLTYEKEDVMKVIYRDSDGERFTLLPLKDRASAGRAYTKDFVPANTEAAKVPRDEGRGAGAERKGG